MKRILKRTLYLNGLDHDIKSLQESIQDKPYFFWYLGDYISKGKARRMIQELEEEKALVLADKNYKPWVGYL